MTRHGRSCAVLGRLCVGRPRGDQHHWVVLPVRVLRRGGRGLPRGLEPEPVCRDLRARGVGPGVRVRGRPGPGAQPHGRVQGRSGQHLLLSAGLCGSLPGEPGGGHRAVHHRAVLVQDAAGRADGGQAVLPLPARGLLRRGPGLLHLPGLRRGIFGTGIPDLPTLRGRQRADLRVLHDDDHLPGAHLSGRELLQDDLHQGGPRAEDEEEDGGDAASFPTGRRGGRGAVWSEARLLRVGLHHRPAGGPGVHRVLGRGGLGPQGFEQPAAAIDLCFGAFAPGGLLLLPRDQEHAGGLVHAPLRRLAALHRRGVLRLLHARAAGAGRLWDLEPQGPKALAEREGLGRHGVLQRQDQPLLRAHARALRLAGPGHPRGDLRVLHLLDHGRAGGVPADLARQEAAGEDGGAVEVAGCPGGPACPACARCPEGACRGCGSVRSATEALAAPTSVSEARRRPSREAFFGGEGCGFRPLGWCLFCLEAYFEPQGRPTAQFAGFHQDYQFYMCTDYTSPQKGERFSSLS